MEHCKKKIPMRAGVCVCEINSACLKGTDGFSHLKWVDEERASAATQQMPFPNSPVVALMYVLHTYSMCDIWFRRRTGRVVYFKPALLVFGAFQNCT